MNSTATHIHFLGIAGIGVSALAQIALAQGRRVSGSDPAIHDPDNRAIQRLRDGGATLYDAHRADNLAPDVDLVVASAAVPDSNPEMQAARERGVRVVSRADYLGELMAAHPGPKIAVAGTHGKTTTTGMIGVMLQEAGLNPTVFVGGEVAQLGGNVRIGSPKGPFVCEACEAYDSFLSLHPDIAIVTNIEADHLDHYGDEAGVIASFRRFLQQVKDPHGDIIVCADDPILYSLSDEIGDLMPYVDYGIDHAASGARAVNLSLSPRPSFDWTSGNHLQTHVELQVPGRHNVLNALAALALCVSLQEYHFISIRSEVAAAGVGAFRGATRRQDVLADITLPGGSVVVMDDYAHHPTEIRATLDALRDAYPQRRIIAVFQPHLYSRTRDFLPAFARELSRADALWVTDIYPAREAPIAGVEAEHIVVQARQLRPDLDAHYLADRHAVPAALLETVRGGDLVVFVGAGNIREQGEAFVDLLKSKGAAA